MLCFRSPHAWVIGSPKCSVFAFIEDYSLSALFLLNLTLQSDFLSDFMTWCHTGPMAIWFSSLCLESGSTRICANLQIFIPTPCPHHQGNEYLQVTNLLTSQRRRMMSRFDTYSIADTMYDPVPNLRNYCKARNDGHGKEEIWP